MKVTSIYGRFAFGIVPAPMDQVTELSVRQASAWGHQFAVCRTAVRDIRLIMDSPDGPTRLPSRRKAILLSESEGPRGPKTLFFSSVMDGYGAMLRSLSASLPGIHLNVEASCTAGVYSKNALTAYQNKKQVRAVYVIHDDSGWEFFERGNRLAFEEADNYASMLKNDRLNPSIIAKYLEKIGYGSLDLSFWTSFDLANLMYEEEFLFANL